MTRYESLKADPDLWLPVMTLDAIQEVGKVWPASVLVDMFEENFRGEKRYIGTKMYEPPVDE